MSQYNYIREHIYKIPSLLLKHFDYVFDNVMQCMPDEALKPIEHIIITGCGYSYIAGLCAKYFLEDIGHVFVEVPFSIDCSRVIKPNHFPKEKTMFFGISNSGIVARIAECLERMQKYGIVTIAVTSDSASRCAEYGDYIVDAGIPELKGNSPLCNFTMTLLFFLLLAWRIAAIKEITKKADADRFFDTFKNMELTLEQQLSSIEEQVNCFSEQVAFAPLFEFVGSGTGYPIAWLGRQLMVGQTGKPAIECSTEDWLHSTFFMCHPEKIATFLIKSSFSNTSSREAEVIHYMTHLKRQLCVITDRPCEKTSNMNQIIVPSSGHVLLDPFTYMVPISLMAGKICELTGEQYSRGFRDNWGFSKGGYATEYSKIEIIDTRR